VSELQNYETSVSKEKEIQEKALTKVGNFARDLHPEDVERRLEVLKDEIQERSKHSETVVKQGGQQSQLQSQSYLRQLEADRKELL